MSKASETRKSESWTRKPKTGAPSFRETALASWLLRETESREPVLVADGGELGCAARVCAALPLRDGDEVHGYLVLAFERALSRSVERALRGCRDDVAGAFRPADKVVSLPVPLAAVS